jgi:3-oxoadipate enol-lactonase
VLALINGASISYDVSGAGAPVVLVAQSECDRRAWRHQIPELQNHFTVVRYDQRGHGESTWGSGGVFSYVDDLSALLDHVGLARAALVGASLGGRVCLELAVTQPERVTRLALLGIGLADWDFSERVRTYWATEEEAYEARDFERAIDLGLELWVDGPNRGPDPAREEARELVRKMNRRCYANPVPDPEPVSAPLDPPASVRLGDVQAPTLVVVGDEDVEDMQRIADVLAHEISNARKVVLPDTAHMIQLERPDEVNRLLVEFLRT